MDSAVNKKRLDKLARIRENQRKSRARKQDHIRELEERLTALQKDTLQKDVQHRLIVQRLEAENKKLRDLLICAGVSAPTLETYLRRADDPVTGQKVAIPALQRLESRSPPQHVHVKSEESTGVCQSGPNATSQVLPIPYSPSGDTQDSSGDRVDNIKSSPDPSLCTIINEDPKSDTEQSLCACLPNEGTETPPTNEEALNTTLCAIAEQLVNQYNFRGLDIAEIGRKLRAGFSRGAKSEGCRVQNQLLFQVLDEISND